jgi:hypothetical protein
MYLILEGKTIINGFHTEGEAKAFVGIDKPTLAGAIVEETILEADLDGDGVIEKAELKTWLQDEEK